MMSAKLPEVAVAERLADQAIALTIEAIPAEVRARAEELLIDVVGLCVAARNTDYVKAVIAGVDAGGPCTAIGHKQTFSAEAAALINGTATHGEDFDDTFEGGPVHSSTVIGPAVLAAVTVATDSQRAGMATVVVFLAIGAAILATVKAR